MVEKRTILADTEGETRGAKREKGQDVEGVESGSTRLLWSWVDDQEDARRRHICLYRRVSRRSFHLPDMLVQTSVR